MPSTPNPVAESCRAAGNKLFNEGQFREAIAQYSRGIQHNSDDVRLFTNRALCYMKLGNVEQCGADSSKAIELDGNNAKARYLYGRCQLKRRDLGGAVKSFKRGMELCCLVGDSQLSSALYADLFNAYFCARKELYDRDQEANVAYMRRAVDDAKNLIGSTKSTQTSEAMSLLEQLYGAAVEGHRGSTSASPHGRSEGGFDTTTSPTTSTSTLFAKPTEIPECFHCPISLEVMKDPVILNNAKSGYMSYDRSSLVEYFKVNKSDPITHCNLNVSDPTVYLLPNVALRSAIHSYLESNPWLYTGAIDPFPSPPPGTPAY